MRMVASAAWVALFLALPAPLFALGMETFGNAPAVKQPDWAQGIVDVVNLKSRVYSQWVNGNEHFFYRGNAPALNEALKQFAAVKDDDRRLILLPGLGQTQTFERKFIEFNWQLHVPSGIYKAVSKRTHAVMTVYINAARPHGSLDRKRIEKWLADLDSDSFQTRDKARKALQQLGKEVKPFLRLALKGQPGLEARRRIQALLNRLQDYDVTDLEIPRGISVVTADDLLAVHFKGLKDPNATVCAMALQDLCVLAPYSDKVVPAMTKMLKKGKNEYVRRVAAACLAHFGSQARSALPALKKGLDDTDANIRHAFQSAIDQIDKAKDKPESVDQVKKKRSILQEINEMKKKAEKN